MDRRSFLRGAAAVPVVLPAVAAATMQQPVPSRDYSRRFSQDKNDPGYRNWCIVTGDGMVVKVYLDGVEQKHCSMADEINGEIERIVMTPSGNMARSHDEILTEIVRGNVRLDIVPMRSPR